VHAAPDIFAARTALGRFYDWAAKVDIPEITRLATTIDRWSDELLAYHHTGRTSSGPVEAVNGEIEAVDQAARSFRNYQHYRIRMLLKTAVTWHTPTTPRLRGRSGQSTPATPPFIA
jgi:transposase